MTQETTELLLTNARFRNAIISLFPIREQAIRKVVFYLLKHKDCNHCVIITEKLLAQKMQSQIRTRPKRHKIFKRQLFTYQSKSKSFQTNHTQ